MTPKILNVKSRQMVMNSTRLDLSWPCLEFLEDGLNQFFSPLLHKYHQLTIKQPLES